MTIAFTGAGSGGHFYPLIAIAEAIQDTVREKHLVAPKLYYLAPEPFDAEALFENGIVFIRIPAGKWRRYFSILNFLDVFVTAVGFLSALITLFRLYPDVLVSKGGFASVPAVLAAHIIGIPILIHESDAKPGRANLLAAPFARRIAISFEGAARYFPQKVQKRIARTGIPIRKALTRLSAEGARQELNLESHIPTVLILGGSLGAESINDILISALPNLVSFTNVIHQTGAALFKTAEGTAKVVLENNPHGDRYHAFGYLSAVSLKRSASVADLIVSRAGAGTIAEISAWKKPAILIPIPEAVSHDQRTNAYAFAHTGGAIVLEQTNLTPHLLASEIKRLVSDSGLLKRMGEHGSGFNNPEAAKTLANEILTIALTHEV